MNKNAIILISLGAAAFLTALFFIYFSNPTPQNQPANQQDNSMAQAIENQTERVLKSGVNANEIVYTITEGEATYGANKQFLGKDAETIVGRTTSLQGTGYWNKDTKEIEVSASVDLSGLATDNPKRDSEVQPLFKSKMATFRIEPTKIDINMSEPFEKEMTGSMTLNGVSKSITFKTKGIVTETNFSIKGDTTIKMSDFGISAPSMAGVFTVGDELPISFKASGAAVQKK